MTALKVPPHFTVHGHRGSRGTHPENTVPGFEEAAQAGAHFIECDVRLTADDVWMVFHDPALSGRLCNHTNAQAMTAPVPFRSLSAQEIKATVRTGGVAQNAFPQQKLFPDLQIPSLEEILVWRNSRAPYARLNIEVKMDDESKCLPTPERVATTLTALITRFQCHDHVLVQSFDHRVVRAVLRHAPTLLTACLFEYAENFVERTLAAGAKIVAPDFSLLTQQIIHTCHQSKLRVIPWTVNRLEDWVRLIGWGVDGLITDYPRQLLSIIRIET